MSVAPSLFAACCPWHSRLDRVKWCARFQAELLEIEQEHGFTR